MAVTEPLFELAIERPTKGSRDASRLIHAQLRDAILAGRLAPGALLPSTRRSSYAFGVSRNTAIKTYEKLLNDGLIETRQGSGTRVVQALPKTLVSSPGNGASAGERLNPFWLGAEVRASIGFWRGEGEDAAVSPVVEFRPALVDPGLFPQAVFRRVMSQQLRGLERTPASYRSPQGSQGNLRLRLAITRHIATTRAIACRATDILIAAGAQQAFDILARSLVKHPGMGVAVEDPGYPPMRAAFAAAGARLYAIPVDDEGLIVERLPAEAKVICLCPSHQFPLGMSMSPGRRKALIRHARHHGCVVVEDDYDGEFRYAGAPLQALISDDAADVVFYVGTFSKCMSPALRLGFVIAPDWAMSTLIAVKNCLDWHCPIATQAAVAAFISEGHLSQHVRKMRKIYLERRRYLTDLLCGPLSPWLEVVPSSYGMHISATSRTGQDLDAVAGVLLRDGIHLHALSRYYFGSAGRTGLIFGLGVSSPDQIVQGAELLLHRLENMDV